MERQSATPSVIKFLGVVVVLLIPMIYCAIAINTSDLLWVDPNFNAQPFNIVVHCFGKDVAIPPGSGEFSNLTTLVNNAISGHKNWDQVSLSDATYQDYQTHSKMMTLELFYQPPVRIHSPYKYFSRVDRIVIPLVGRHSEANTIFGRRMNKSVGGSFHVQSTTSLVEYLTTRDLCLQN